MTRPLHGLAAAVGSSDRSGLQARAGRLGVGLFWHLNIAVRLLGLALDGEKALFDLFQHRRIIVDQPSVQADLDRHIWHQ